MFKISKLNEVDEERLIVDYGEFEINFYNPKKIEKFKTLIFSIEGKLKNNNYCFSFSLNCKPSKLMEIKEKETTNFKKYLFETSAILTINGVAYLDPKYEININRYLMNNFVININFISETDPYYDNIFCGIIEFEFDLNDYLYT